LILNNIFKTKQVLQLVKYGVVGVAAFLVDFTIFSLLSRVIHYQIANYCGLLSGLALNFVLSKFWVFHNKIGVNKGEVFSYLGFTVIAFAFTGMGMYVGIECMHLNKQITKFIVAVLVFFLNYFARRYVIFKQR
jgi:putative flippase GtrA